MTLARRALYVILPVVLVSNLLVACAVYWLQASMIEDSERTRFTTRMERLADAFVDEVEFTRNLVFSMLAGETVQDFVREENPEFQVTGLGVKVQDGIRFLSGAANRFVSFAIVAPDGSVAYYFENSEDPFAEMRPEQVVIARRLLESPNASSDEYVPNDGAGLVVHSQLIDRRTFEPPLASQREFSYVIQSAVKPKDFAALRAALEADYGSAVSLGPQSPSTVADAAFARDVAHDLTLRGDFPAAHVAVSLLRLKGILASGSVVLSLLSVGLLIFLIKRTVTGPIALLDREVKEVIDGAREELSATERTGEVGRLSINIKAMHDETLRAFRNVQQMTWTDPLTGIANRPRFNVVGQEWMEATNAGRGVFSLLFIDLDNFKGVNDVFGHAAGDAVLKTFANRAADLAASWGARQVEAIPARLAGDEFAFLVRGDSEVAIRLASDILELFVGGLQAGRKTYPVSVSVGVATAPKHADAFDELISCADLAMYRAKAAGRGRHAVFEQSPRALLEAS
ncbi:hypothetical protein ASG43_18930 [Aureimonas sp. Leaf454]|uniref:GGDEF domain-containing protein n=1 Tax=Aureimonas sp. Leaf454 TaxID=1736381 RepID=UPI0006F8E699|nr:GGDEF domain-containing protein [Aureimonas sp. Leaf454]KQT53292.1 hypothetical protein ASG43_18930 [Aureimonas sp. Leaf454]